MLCTVACLSCYLRSPHGPSDYTGIINSYIAGSDIDPEEGDPKPKGPVKEIGPTLVGAPVASMKDKMIEVICNN